MAGWRANAAPIGEPDRERKIPSGSRGMRSSRQSFTAWNNGWKPGEAAACWWRSLPWPRRRRPRPWTSEPPCKLRRGGAVWAAPRWCIWSWMARCGCGTWPTTAWPAPSRRSTSITPATTSGRWRTCSTAKARRKPGPGCSRCSNPCVGAARRASCAAWNNCSRPPPCARPPSKSNSNGKCVTFRTTATTCTTKRWRKPGLRGAVGPPSRWANNSSSVCAVAVRPGAAQGSPICSDCASCSRTVIIPSSGTESTNNRGMHRHEAGVFQGMIKIHDLHAVLEVLPAHVFQSRGPVDQQHHLARASHAPPNGLLAQRGPKLVDRLEAGDIGGRIPVAHRMPFLIDAVLGKDTAQVNLTGLGRAIGLLAAPAFQFLRAHGHARPVPAHLQNRCVARARLGGPLLPSLRVGAHALDDPLNLAGGHLDAAGLFQVSLGFQVGSLVGAF